MARHKDVSWILPELNGAIPRTEYETAQLAVLMDIRDELKRLNSLLNCSNCTAIPREYSEAEEEADEETVKVKHG